MNNYARVLRIALAHRWNVIAAVLCSVVVAFFWAFNLAAVWPVVDVIMQNRSLHEWVADEATQAEASLAAARTAIEQVNEQLVDAPLAEQAGLHRRLAMAQHDAATFASKSKWIAKARPWVERWLPSTPFHTLLLVCGLVMVCTLLKNALRIVSLVLVGRLGAQVSRELRDKFYAHMLRLDMAEFSERGRGDLMNRCTNDLGAVGAGVQTLFGQAVLEPLKMITCFVAAAMVSWRLLIVVVIIAPIVAVTIRWLSKAIKRANRRAMEELSGIFETLGETLSGMKLIKAFTMEPIERRRFEAASRMLYRRSLKITFYNSLVSPLTENLGVAMVVMAALAGGYLVLNQETHLLGLRISNEPLTHGMMSVFFAMLVGMSDPARRLSSLLQDIQRASASADRVYEVLDREPTIVDPKTPVPLPPLRRALVFQDINFAYHADRPVLIDATIEVAAGETIAIVGPNGCGKSTLLNLLPRFFDADSGSITIDGVNVRDVRLEDLRKRIGLVTQDAVLFNDTVASNIAYGADGATSAQIEAAARQAHAHAFIMEKLSDGYDTIVGNGGSRLSGGQRQRVALARAILRDPEILILDEATSQIDVESEHLIHQVLEEFTQGRTTLLITHRPSTLTLADRVVVMDKGRVIDVGRPEELLGRCDLFRRLCHVNYRESA